MDLNQLPASHCASSLDTQSGSLILLLINALLASQCALENAEHYPIDSGEKLQDGDHFDFIVIGAGSAGSMVSSRLVQEGKWKVLVLEAGGIPSATSEIPYMAESIQKTSESIKYLTEPSEHSCLAMKNGSCHWPRGRVLGGCSSINSMIYVRGNKGNYDSWVEDGNEGWSYEEVLKNFKTFEKQLNGKSEHYGSTGSLPLFRYSMNETLRDAILESAKDLGLEILETDGKIGILEAPLTTNGKVRFNTAKAFLGSVRDSDKLTLAMNALVTKIIINKNGKKAEGVEVRLGERTIKIFANKEVILSAGALNSPQLLMLSGLGLKQHLQEFGIEVIHDLPVGHNLQDHIMFLMFVKVNDEAIEIKHEKEVMMDLFKYFINGDGDLSTIGITNIQAYLNVKNNSEYADAQIMYASLPKGDPFFDDIYMENMNFNEELSRNIIRLGQESNILFSLVTLLQPKSRGKVELRSADPFDTIKIHSGYLSDSNGEDLETMLKGIRFAQAQLKTEAFRRVAPEVLDIRIPNCKGFQFDSDDYWRCAVRNIGSTMYHPTSTCRMGPASDKSSVVDSRLRVHGMKGLRVVDASILPSIVSANTNAASIMIGHKGAEMIIDDHTNKHIEL